MQSGDGCFAAGMPSLDGDESHSVRGDVPTGGDVAQGRGDARLAWEMSQREVMSPLARWWLLRSGVES